MTDTINVPRKLLERIIGKMNIVYQQRPPSPQHGKEGGKV